MKFPRIYSLIGLAGIVLSNAWLSSTPVDAQQESKFVCDTTSNVPATVVQSSQYGNVTLIKWQSDHFAQSGFSPDSRCHQVSSRFQKYYQQGTLKFFTTGLINRQSVICAVATQNSPCNQENLLYTLKPGSDPNQTLKQLLNIRSRATSNPLNEAGSRIYVEFDSLLKAKAQERENAEATNTTNEPMVESNSLF
jgi:Circadian oscillating protein COP23